MNTYLMHHGVKGQRWGIRRYQNEDGSLTKEGRKRLYKQYRKDAREAEDRHYKRARKDFDVDAKELKALKLKQKYEIEDDDDTSKYDWYKRSGKREYDRATWDYEDADDKAHKVAKEKARKELLRKYGEETLEDLESTRRKREAVATGATIAAMLGGVALAAAISNSSSEPKGRATNRRSDKDDNVVWEAEYKEVNK